MMKTRVKADKMTSYKRGQEDYGFEIEEEIIPVDLYGKRVYSNKNNSSNLTNAGEDIKAQNGLEIDGL